MKSIIIYDFDGTLTPYSLPKFEILEKCGLQHGALNPNFLEMSKNKAQDEKVDLYTAIYRTYFEIIKNANLSLSDDNFCLGANTVIYNNGVVDFLNFLKDNGVSNYLLSSGIKVYLEKTNIAHFFEEIYGTTFIYNSNGEAVGIDYLMSDKNKVDAIKDIVKMTGNNENDCQNIIYIGDGFTDYYAMEYVKRNGGTSIFVYKNKNSQDLKRLEEKDVISFSTYADFSYDSQLSEFIKN